MLTDFALFRKHCRADDFDDETEYLRDLLEAAEETIIRATNRTAAELVEMGGGSLPKPLQIAAFSIGAHWYNKRKTMNAARKKEHAAPVFTGDLRGHGLARIHRRARWGFSCYPLVLLAASYNSETLCAPIKA